MVTFKKTNKFANRGVKSEEKVQAFLTVWAESSDTREFNRLVDAKAAGRTIKAAAADFEFYAMRGVSRYFGLIEVKETEHEYRLARDKVPQLARLRKRAKCGGICIVLVHHSTTGVWRAASAEWLSTNGDKGSWNLSCVVPSFSPREALHAHFSEVFA